MAKLQPTVTSQQMEKELGYDVQALASTGALTRLYSDLGSVTNSAYGRIKREYQEHQLVHDKRVSKEALQALDEIQTLTYNRNIVTLVKLSDIGFYRFAVDIHYEFGVHLPFLLSEREAYRTVSVAKLRYHGKQGTIPAFFKLPREIRDMVYTFALPHGKWGIQNLGNFDRFRLTAAIGDPTGFYFPLGNNLGILSVSKQVRQEALPLAYTTTAFYLDDMDDLLKLLVAVGEIGRQNIESLYFPWESRSDSERKWEESLNPDGHFLQLPKLHVVNCLQLLKQCKRLRFLCLYFESDLLDEVDPKVFKTDPGIQVLRSIHVETVEIWSLGHKSLEQHSLAQWLKTCLERPSV